MTSTFPKGCIEYYMKGRRAGLVTWVGGPNYGTVLQACALHRLLSDLGYEPVIVRRYPFVWGVKLSLDRILHPMGINILKTRDEDSLKMKRVRAFQKAYGYRRIVGPFGYAGVRRRCDVLVCGSDQIWNTRNKFDPFLFLSFAGNRDRVAYAASLGNPELEPERMDDLRRLLLPFRAIGMREDSGREALSRLTGREDIRTVLDPTLAIPADRWLEICGGAAPGPDGPYVLCYLLRRRDDYEAIIGEVKARTGLEKVVVIPSAEYPDIKVPGAVYLPETGPAEFVSLFSKAAFVVTDSYHGTLFSINFNVDFTVLRRFDDTDAGSQNSRLYDILARLVPGDRMFDPAGGGWAEKIDWNAVNAVVTRCRRESMQFLENNLKDDRGVE